MNTILSFVGGLSFISISKKLCSRFLPLIYDRKTYLRYQNKPEKWILVTGASGGIGFSFCKKFAVLNYNLILIGRDEKKLIKVK
jgi:NADPH:quinone reductase-like Zn-dependent oxidoreductase